MTNTDKILAEFDELPIFSVPIIEGVDSVRTFVVDVQIVKDFLTTKIAQAIAEERARMRGILSDENYKLEEWYCSSLRPTTLTHYEANQRNMKTRNEIEQLISFPQDKLTDKE